MKRCWVSACSGTSSPSLPHRPLTSTVDSRRLVAKRQRGVRHLEPLPARRDGADAEAHPVAVVDVAVEARGPAAGVHASARHEDGDEPARRMEARRRYHADERPARAIRRQAAGASRKSWRGAGRPDLRLPAMSSGPRPAPTRTFPFINYLLSSPTSSSLSGRRRSPKPGYASIGSV